MKMIQEEVVKEQKRIDGILKALEKNLLTLKELQDILRDFSLPDYGRLSSGEDFFYLNKQDWRIMITYGYLLLGQMLKDTEICLYKLDELNLILTPDENIDILFSFTGNVIDLYEKLGWNSFLNDEIDTDDVKEFLPNECELLPNVSSIYDNCSYYVFYNPTLAEYLNKSPCREQVIAIIRKYEKKLFSGIGNPVFKNNDFFYFSDNTVYCAEMLYHDSAFYGVSTPLQSFIILDAINKIATGGTYGKKYNRGES